MRTSWGRPGRINCTKVRTWTSDTDGDTESAWFPTMLARRTVVSGSEIRSHRRSDTETAPRTPATSTTPLRGSVEAIATRSRRHIPLHCTASNAASERKHLDDHLHPYSQ